MLGDELQRAFEAGSSATPLRIGIAALDHLNPIERARVLGVLADWAPVAAQALGGRARSDLASRLPRRPGDAIEAACFDRLAGAFRAAGVAPGPGVVTVLLGSELLCDGVPVGASHPLVVSATQYGGGNRLKYAGEEDPTLLAGFVAGTDAARAHLIPLVGGRDDLVRRLAYNWHFSGEIASLRSGARGESLGLAAAVAAISAVAGLPVAQEVAFTGRTDANGRLHPVSHLASKLQAAADAGITLVYVPVGCDVPAAPPVTVCEVEQLGDVVARVFDRAALDAGLAPLRERQPAVPYERYWDATADRRPRAFLSMVGGSDPIGTFKDAHGVATNVQEDGPIITGCRELRPAEVHLFFTTATPHNDYTGKAKDTSNYIKALLGDATHVTLHDLPPGLDDPTDLESVYAEMHQRVTALCIDGLDARCACFLNTASGTGQMAFVMAVLQMSGAIHGRLIHVRESRWVKDDRPRIREVVLPTPWATTGEGTHALA